jgi:hypothetical protein
VRQQVAANGRFFRAFEIDRWKVRDCGTTSPDCSASAGQRNPATGD